MARIKSLYDALVGTQIEENQCTNFLVWLLQKLPRGVLEQICEASNLSLYKETRNRLDDQLEFRVQYPLPFSIPDAVIESRGKALIIETKMYPNSLDKVQFMNHFIGACKEFGDNNVWLLFLSGDKKTPPEIDKLNQKHTGRGGYLSWETLLGILRDSEKQLDEKYKIAIEEFLLFAARCKLGRLIAMNNEEMAKFIEGYSELEKFREPCTSRLLQVLDKCRDSIILECEERVEKSKDMQKKLPCLYRELSIKVWHTDPSAYIYINILQKMVGICFVGYQSKNEKEKFRTLWEIKLKAKYRNDLSLTSFTWVEKGDDELAFKQ
jgi:hypothetical protein